MTITPEAFVLASNDELSSLALAVAQMSPEDAASALEQEPDTKVVEVLRLVNPSHVQDILLEFDDERRTSVLSAAPSEIAEQWSLNRRFEEGTVGRLMEPPIAVFRPEITVAEAVEKIRQLSANALITYGYIVDGARRLIGIITMRDLLLGERDRQLDELMLRSPFSLTPELELSDALRLVLNRHFPVYPVCDGDGRLVGLVRGRALFEEQAFEISAQPGSMVGVEKEERLATQWSRSLRFRHPWLQLNLLTAFIAAAVVGAFQGTVDKFVILAMFLPVLAGQSGNTGCQALAVTLRGITLGELEAGRERLLVLKEALLGLLNGALVGISAAVGMYVVARAQHNDHALILAGIVLLAMTGSCVVSGIAGAMIPMTLRKLGADPATASSIFLTTATDVVSMGLLLGLATWVLL